MFHTLRSVQNQPDKIHFQNPRKQYEFINAIKGNLEGKDVSHSQNEGIVEIILDERNSSESVIRKERLLENNIS